MINKSEEATLLISAIRINQPGQSGQVTTTPVLTRRHLCVAETLCGDWSTPQGGEEPLRYVLNTQGQGEGWLLFSASQKYRILKAFFSMLPAALAVLGQMRKW